MGEDEAAFSVNFPQRLGGSSSSGDVSIDWTALAALLGRFYLFSSERVLHNPDTVAQGIYSLTPGGNNLLQVLNALASRRPTVFRSIVEHIKTFLPGVADLVVPLVTGENNVYGELREEAFGDDPVFAWEELSAGTRHIVGLVTFLLSTPRSSLLIIEEPESFVHADVAVGFYRLCERVGRDEKKQIIMTTHSPLLIDMGLSSLNIVIRDPTTGASRIERPSSETISAIEERGVLRTYMLAPFKAGDFPLALLIVEGSDDVAVWKEWLLAAGLTDRGVEVVRGGDGEREAVKLALQLRHQKNAGIRDGPFLLVIDSDGELEKKKERLLDQGLLAEDFHILEMKEIEDYLKVPAPLAQLLNVDVSKVEELVATVRPGKEGLNQLVSQLSTAQAADQGFKRLLASKIEPSADLAEVIDRLNNITS